MALQLFQHRLAQRQQPQSIGHGGAGFSNPFRGFLLRHAIPIDQCVIALCLFNRVQILPLQIFNQGQLHGLPVVRLHNDDGDLIQFRQTGGPPAALTGDDLIVPIGHFPDGQGLDDTVLPDGFRQRFQLFIVKIPPGLVGIWFDFMQGEHFQSVFFFRLL